MPRAPWGRAPPMINLDTGAGCPLSAEGGWSALCDGPAHRSLLSTAWTACEGCLGPRDRRKVPWGAEILYDQLNRLDFRVLDLYDQLSTQYPKFRAQYPNACQRDRPVASRTEPSPASRVRDDDKDPMTNRFPGIAGPVVVLKASCGAHRSRGGSRTTQSK